MADNDLAIGRVVDAVSHSPYWNDTAIFIVEDDAQDGADHVDAHRSLALVISKYAPGSAEQPHVEHGFFTTVSLIRTMEAVLGLPPMNHNDAYAPVMSSLFSGAGDQPAFEADTSNLQNGLIFQVNAATAVGRKRIRRHELASRGRRRHKTPQRNFVARQKRRHTDAVAAPFRIPCRRRR